jgi:hypothetical protein
MYEDACVLKGKAVNMFLVIFIQLAHGKLDWKYHPKKKMTGHDATVC